MSMVHAGPGVYAANGAVSSIYIIKGLQIRRTEGNPRAHRKTRGKKNHRKEGVGSHSNGPPSLTSSILEHGELFGTTGKKKKKSKD